MASPSSTPTKKRKVTEEFPDIASVCSTGSAGVHGIVSRLSPMKQGKKSAWYEGCLSDGKDSIRIYGFTESQHKQLSEFKEKKEPIHIVDCEVKKARGESDKVEVLVKQFTEIEKSSKDYEVEDVTNVITLDMLPNIEEFETVTLLEVEVTDLEIPMEVTGGKIKQDVHIADNKGKSKLTLWEEDVGKLEEGTCCSLHDVLVRSFQKRKHLSFARGASITIINSANIEKLDSKMDNCEVIGVLSMNVHQACRSCKQKVVATTEKLGSCTKCGMKQRLENNVTAKLMISDDNNVQKFFSASGAILSAIAGVDTDLLLSEELLLSAKPFSITYKNNTIINVSRK